MQACGYGSLLAAFAKASAPYEPSPDEALAEPGRRDDIAETLEIVFTPLPCARIRPPFRNRRRCRSGRCAPSATDSRASLPHDDAGQSLPARGFHRQACETRTPDPL